MSHLSRSRKSASKTTARPGRPAKGVLTARRLMTPVVHTISADTPIQKIVETLIRHGISALPVIDGERRVIGMVSEGDLFRRRELGTNKRRPGWLDILIHSDRLARDYIKSHAKVARDIMTTKVVSVTEDTSASEIADMLETHRIKRVPVIRDGKLVGIVARADLVRALLAPSRKQGAQANSRTIREAFLQRLRKQPWTVGASVNVVVRDRVVELWGSVATEDEVRALGVMAESIPGVTEVRNRLTAGRKGRARD